jgi:hypothetical protein
VPIAREVREQVRLADARQKDEMQFTPEYNESRADGPPEDKVPPHPRTPIPVHTHAHRYADRSGLPRQRMPTRALLG